MSRQIELEIVGLAGEESARRADAALRNNQGVIDARVLAGEGRAFVLTAPGVIIEHLLESLETAGFLARPAAPGDED